MRIPDRYVALAFAAAALMACGGGEPESPQRDDGWAGREELPPERHLEMVKKSARDAGLRLATPKGLWRKARKPNRPISDAERRRMEELAALPYLSGYVEAPMEQDVVLYDPERAHNGYNLYNSGHRPEASLIDMEGRSLHTWTLAKDAVWPEERTRKMAFYWRRVFLYPNGDLLVVFNSYGMLKLDKNSNLLWKYTRGCHHDLEVTADGNIYVLYREPVVLEGYNDDEPVLPDGVVVLSPDGEPLEEYWILDYFQNSSYAYMLEWIPSDVVDVLHANSVRVFDGSLEHLSSLYKEGNILIALRKIDVVAIIDPDQRSIVWAASGIENGLWHRQHDPRVLANGNMLLFDNRGRGPVERTNILEFAPLTLRVHWQYSGTAETPLYSRTLGASHRLPNGNTLISESNYGRAIEVTQDGEIVWEFINPHRAGDDDELIATLFEMQRIEYDYVRFLDNPVPRD